MKPIKNAKNLKTQLQQAAYQAHGSGKTRSNRKNKLGQFENYLKRNNIQIRHIDQIKTKYIEAYIQERKEQGINLRTLQNDMSAIRKTLTAAGREKLAYSDRLSNKTLNIRGASRKGTKVAINDQQYQHIHQKALKTHPSIAAGIELGRTLGLRSEEIVQSCQSLKTWQKELNKGAAKLKIIFGTKGGRPRETIVINRERVLKAVNTALQLTEQQNGKLIDKPNLKQAMTYWRNHCSSLGLKGEISPHSLRYAFANDAIDHYQQQNYSPQEIYALTSMDLGHGDGRGRYVKYIYSNR